MCHNIKYSTIYFRKGVQIHINFCKILTFSHTHVYKLHSHSIITDELKNKIICIGKFILFSQNFFYKSNAVGNEHFRHGVAPNYYFGQFLRRQLIGVLTFAWICHKSKTSFSAIYSWMYNIFYYTASLLTRRNHRLRHTSANTMIRRNFGVSC